MKTLSSGEGPKGSPNNNRIDPTSPPEQPKQPPLADQDRDSSHVSRPRDAIRIPLVWTISSHVEYEIVPEEKAADELPIARKDDSPSGK